MAHKNETALRKADAEMLKGNVQAMFDLFDDDVVFHIGGRNKMSGDFKSKEMLQEMFAKLLQVLGTPEMETHDILANDTHGIILQTFRGERGGERITINSIATFHFGAGGKITEAWFIDEDPYTADPFYDGGL